MHVPPVVAPLVWLLLFVFVVAMVYAGLKWMGITLHATLERLMVGLVGLIVIVVLILWLFSLIGYPLLKL